MKTISFKKKLLLILSFIMCTAIIASGAIFGVNTAKADGFGFETVENVQIRVHNEKERLGIRYQIRMESEQYKTFMETYTNVEFGAFIIPEDYRDTKGAFTELNLFGGVVEGEEVAPVYYWGDVADEYKTGKTQIINLSTNAMTKVEEDGGVSYNTIYAAITNVKTQNATRAFAGVGYVKYTDGDTVKYIIDDNGSEYSYSIAQVADNALENLPLEDDQIAAIEQITAIKPAVKVDSSVTSSALTTAVSNLDYAMGSELDITEVANANAPAGMVLDEQNSVLTATVPYVGYAEFDVNYVYDVETLDGKNLLEYTNLFATDSLISKSITCCSECVISQPDVSEGNPYYPGKYIYSYCTDWTGPSVYINKNLVSAMIAEGNTILTVVYGKGSNSPVISINNFDLNSYGGYNYGSSTTADGLTTTTFDLTKLSFTDHIAIRHAGNTLGQLYIYDINFSKISTTGNIATTLQSSGIATSTYNAENYGQLFHYGTNNTLYFNVWAGYANYMILDNDFVANCFKLGLTTVKMKYYANPWVAESYVQLGLRKFDGSAYTDLSSRLNEPYLGSQYNSVDNQYEATWNITPEEVASFNFETDSLRIGYLQSASGKFQIVITHFEFCRPVEEPEPEVDYNGLNLLTLDNVFNTTLCELECVDSHASCWVQYLDISASDEEAWGYSGKYINMSRQGYCDVGLYLDVDFYLEMIDQGMTTLTVVAERTGSQGNGDMNIKFYNYNPDTNSWTPSITGAPVTDDNGLTTWTFDLTTIDITHVPMIGMTGGIGGALYIVDVSFSK